MDQRHAPTFAPDFAGASRQAIAYLEHLTGVRFELTIAVVSGPFSKGAAATEVSAATNPFRWSGEHRPHSDIPHPDTTGSAPPLVAILPIRDAATSEDDLRARLVPHATAIEIVTTMLGGILAAERRSEAAERDALLARVDLMHDDLTGLRNRRGWNAAITAEESRCARHGRSAVVAIIDLDDLKATNDRDGHDAGDRLLRRAAAAIDAATRTHDIAARIGGDEFAVLASECDPGDARRLAERLRLTLAAADISASFGYAARRPESGLEEAVRAADRRMYEHKQLRRLVYAPH